MKRLIQADERLTNALRIVDLLAGPKEVRDSIVLDLEPVIAGGAPRDLVLDQPVKDFDIFLPIPKPFMLDVALWIVDRVKSCEGHRAVPNTGNRDYSADYCGRPEMLAALTIEALDVDIVLFDKAAASTPEGIVNTFDNSLSRCWLEVNDWDVGHGVAGTDYIVRGTFDFARSVRERIIWTYPHIPTRPAHLARVARKFDDYHMVFCDPELEREVSKINRNIPNWAA